MKQFRKAVPGTFSAGLFKACLNAFGAQTWTRLIRFWRHCPGGKASARRLTNSGACSSR